MAAERVVKAKKRCCKSNPRCKRCPVVLKRLREAGYAERLEGRVHVVRAPKKALKKARRRKASFS
jgi:hypothetical protein